MNKYNISVVSYTNTLPFRVGLETSAFLQQKAHFTYDNPAMCAENLLSGKSDIGLVPIAVLANFEKYNIVADYCIGAEDKVDTVKLYTEVPIEKVHEIVLDNQSRTSIELVKYLANNYWHISPTYVAASDGFEQKPLKPGQGMVVIGDRTFLLDGTHNYQYDLAEIWHKATGLPFVFAMWVSIKDIDPEFKKEFNRALRAGVERIDLLADQFAQMAPDNINLGLYLSQRISYQLNEDKMKAVELFLDYLKNGTTSL